MVFKLEKSFSLTTVKQSSEVNLSFTQGLVFFKHHVFVKFKHLYFVCEFLVYLQLLFVLLVQFGVFGFELVQLRD